MKKKIYLCCISAVSMLLLLSSSGLFAEDAKCSNIDTFEKFKEALKEALNDPACTQITLDKTIVITESMEIQGTKDKPLIVAGNQDSKTDIGLSLNKDVDVVASNLKLQGTGALVIAGGATMLCANCDIQLKIINSGTFIFSTGNSAKSMAVYTKTDKDTLLYNINFENFGDGYAIKINGGDLSGSTFRLKSTDSAITTVDKLGAYPLSKVLMIANNKYILNGTGSLELAKIFKYDTASNMYKLGKPSIKYAGSVSNNYRISVNNIFGKTSDQKWKWGNFECPGTAHGNDRHINFEPYFLQYEDSNLIGVYPIGIYTFKTAETIKYIEIPKTANIKTGTDDTTLKDGDSIAMLVHCEGTGTTKFSDPLILKNPDNCAIMSLDGTCLQCNEAEGYYSKSGVCTPCTGEGSAIKEGKCVCDEEHTLCGGACLENCAEGMVMQSDCICGVACQDNEDKVGSACLPKCDENSTRGASGDCVCNAGSTKYPERKDQDAKCVTCSGKVINGKCQCSNSSYIIALTGECIAPVAGKKCSDQDVDAIEEDDICVCKTGYKWDPGAPYGDYAPSCEPCAEGDPLCTVPLDCSLDINKDAVDCDCSADINKDAAWCAGSTGPSGDCGCRLGAAPISIWQIILPYLMSLTGVAGLIIWRRGKLSRDSRA